jgi:ribosome assembly protein 1
VLGPIVASRGLSHAVPAKLLEGSAEPRAAVKAVLKAWLPLSEAVLGMAVTHLPSPAAAAPVRLPHLLSGGRNTPLLPAAATRGSSDAGGGGGASSSGSSDGAADLQQQLERTYSHLCASSSAADAPLVVFVSKMVSIPANLLPRRPGEAGEQVRQGHQGIVHSRQMVGREVACAAASLPGVAIEGSLHSHARVAPTHMHKHQGDAGSGEVFLAFGRVFSGVAREGARVHVLSSAYDPAHPDRQRQSAVLRGLYLMMGR